MPKSLETLLKEGEKVHKDTVQGILQGGQSSDSEHPVEKATKAALKKQETELKDAFAGLFKQTPPSEGS